MGDGAVCIWNLAGEHFGERGEILDYYHAKVGTPRLPAGPYQPIRALRARRTVPYPNARLDRKSSQPRPSWGRIDLAHLRVLGLRGASDS